MANIHTQFESLLDIVAIGNTITGKKATSLDVKKFMVSIDDTTYSYELFMTISLEENFVIVSIYHHRKELVYCEKVVFNKISDKELARWFYNILEKVGEERKIRFEYSTFFERKLNYSGKKCGELIKESFEEAKNIIPDGKYKTGIEEILKYSKTNSFLTKSPRVMEKLFDDHAFFLKKVVLDFWSLPDEERQIDFINDLEIDCVDSFDDPLI